MKIYFNILHFVNQPWPLIAPLHAGFLYVWLILSLSLPAILADEPESGGENRKGMYSLFSKKYLTSHG